jgi:hypothetical protein
LKESQIESWFSMLAEQSWLALLWLGGLGIGGLATAVIQHLLSRRDSKESLRFSEKKEAFTRLLSALADLDRLEGDSTVHAEATYALAVAHVQLVASERVLRALNAWRHHDPGSSERNKHLRELVSAMRQDLGIAVVHSRWRTLAGPDQGQESEITSDEPRKEFILMTVWGLCRHQQADR